MGFADEAGGGVRDGSIIFSPADPEALSAASSDLAESMLLARSSSEELTGVEMDVLSEPVVYLAYTEKRNLLQAD